MGTLTVTTPYARSGYSIVRAAGAGDVKLVPFTFAFSTSYATGGDTIPAGSLPAGYKDLVSPWAENAPGGLGLQLDVANSKLKLFASGVESSAAFNAQTGLGSGAFTVWFKVR